MFFFSNLPFFKIKFLLDSHLRHTCFLVLCQFNNTVPPKRHFFSSNQTSIFNNFMGMFHFYEWLLGLSGSYRAEVPFYSFASSCCHQWLLALGTKLLHGVLKVGQAEALTSLPGGSFRCANPSELSSQQNVTETSHRQG